MKPLKNLLFDASLIFCTVVVCYILIYLSVTQATLYSRTVVIVSDSYISNPDNENYVTNTFMINLIKDICHKESIKYVYKVSNINDCILGIENGKYDIFIGVKESFVAHNTKILMSHSKFPKNPNSFFQPYQYIIYSNNSKGKKLKVFIDDSIKKMQDQDEFNSPLYVLR